MPVVLIFKNTADVDENFLKAMADMGVDGQDPDFNQGVFPMMQGMMMNLLSKDVLYPALDELRTKVSYLMGHSRKLYRAFALIPQGPTQQKPWRPCWCSRQKSLIKILLNWNANMAAVTSCANALYTPSTQEMFAIQRTRKENLHLIIVQYTRISKGCRGVNLPFPLRWGRRGCFVE
jgi:hypothetical protein